MITTTQKEIVIIRRNKIINTLVIVFLATVGLIITASLVLSGFDLLTSKNTDGFFALAFLVPWLASITYVLHEMITKYNTWYMFDENNFLVVFNKDEIIETYEFSNIEAISLGGVSRKHYSHSGIFDTPYPIYEGFDKHGKRIKYHAINSPSLTNTLLKVKKRFPNVEIEQSFSRYISFIYHKKLFGSYNKERLFLFVFLISVIIVLPVLIIGSIAISNIVSSMF